MRSNNKKRANVRHVGRLWPNLDQFLWYGSGDARATTSNWHPGHRLGLPITATTGLTSRRARLVSVGKTTPNRSIRVGAGLSRTGHANAMSEWERMHPDRRAADPIEDCEFRA